MKHKYINKGKNDKSKHLNNPPILNNKNLEKLKYQLYFQKCKNNSLKICNEMNNLSNIYA